MNRGLRSRDKTILALQEHIHHAYSLLTAKPLTDTSPPKSFTPVHSYLRGKGAYFYKEKTSRISKDNATLCTKIRKAICGWAQDHGMRRDGATHRQQ